MNNSYILEINKIVLVTEYVPAGFIRFGIKYSLFHVVYQIGTNVSFTLRWAVEVAV